MHVYIYILCQYTSSGCVFYQFINYLILGEWKCQVTSSSFDSGDALSSRPARLVVRIPPEDPQIYYKGQLMNDKVSKSIDIHKTISNCG